MNQSQLSLKAGVSRGTVFDIENGRRVGNVGLSTAELLAAALSVPVCWLAYGVGSPDGAGGDSEAAEQEALRRIRVDCVLMVLDARKVALSEDVRAEIMRAEVPALDRLLLRAATARSVADLF